MKQKMLSVAFRRNSNFPFSSIYTFAVHIQIIVQSKVLNIFILVCFRKKFRIVLWRRRPSRLAWPRSRPHRKPTAQNTARVLAIKTIKTFITKKMTVTVTGPPSGCTLHRPLWHPPVIRIR